MPKLHEIIAVTSGKKGDAEKAVTETYHLVQKPDLFDGLAKTYRPIDEGGENLPPESKHPQMNLKELVASAVKKWEELFDLTLTLDAGNQVAKGNVEVDGLKLEDVPVPTLLFLEKQLGDIKAFIGKLPVPDPAERWKLDASQGMLATDPVQTSRTKKLQKPIVLYPATDKHPAQTQLVTEDVLAGFWTTIKYTTRLSADLKAAMLDRVGKLLDAVKTARERANAIDVTKRKMGETLLTYIFNGALK